MNQRAKQTRGLFEKSAPHTFQVAGGSKLVKKKNKEPKHRQNKYINKQNLNLYNKGKVGLTFLIVGEGS